MRSSKVIHVVTCHAEGEVGDVSVGGVAPPPGDTIWEQSRFIASDETLRNFVLNEPRGGVFRHVNLLVPPKHPGANMGWIIMEPADTPPVSGSNAICVGTVLLDTGILPMREPLTEIVLEAPAGLIAITARCRAGKAEAISLRNVPSFATRLGAPLEVAGLAGRPLAVAGRDDEHQFGPAARGRVRPSRVKRLRPVGPVALHRDGLRSAAQRRGWRFTVHRTDRPASELLLFLHGALGHAGDTSTNTGGGARLSA